MAETERQVEGHLDDHLARLPEGDDRSRAILEQMKLDEAKHAQSARDAGGAALPLPVRLLMKLAAKVMTTTAYRV
jgi:ubiquinone biosynthesis monooxygenase Coq7